MWDGFDQRKFPRLKLQCELVIQCKNSEGGVITAATENVGAGGVCVLQEEPLERFSRCHVRLTLVPNEPPVECEGKICWIVRKKEMKSKKEKFDTGIEFVGLDKVNRDRIANFLREKLRSGFQEIQ